MQVGLWAIAQNHKIRKRLKLLRNKVATWLLASMMFVSPLGANAAQVVHVKKYANCKELNAKYPGGVAKSKTAKNKGGATKLKPTVSAKVYKENATKDRDKDGIACER